MKRPVNTPTVTKPVSDKQIGQISKQSLSLTDRVLQEHFWKKQMLYLPKM